MSRSERRNRRTLIPIYALLCTLTVLGRFLIIPLSVPITLQFLFTNTSALLLGKKGCIPPLVYMLLGLVGLPIFASGGGVGSILEPSFGFVIGLVLGALVTGTIVGHKRSTLALAAASAAGMLCLYLCGTVYFLIIEGVYLAQPVGLTEALCICIFPFILPDALKIALSIILYKKLTAHIKIQPTDRT